MENEKLLKDFLQKKKIWNDSKKKPNRYLLREEFKKIEPEILKIIGNNFFFFEGYVLKRGFFKEVPFVYVYTEESFKRMKEKNSKNKALDNYYVS